MYTDLRQLLTVLRKSGELIEISAPVDPFLEAAEIHRRVIEQGGPALLFTKVKNSDFPLLTNLFGTSKRIELAFGPRPEKFMREIASFPATLVPPTPKKLWDNRRPFLDLLKIGLKRVRTPPCLEVVQTTPQLERLPLLTTWKEDGGAFITLPLVYTEHPETHVHNLGMYRLQRFDNATTGFHCQIGKGGGFHLSEAEKRNSALPVNVFIGGAPALILSAIAPLPENVPELLLASLVQGRKFELATNPLGPLPLAAHAEFTLIGEVTPHVRRPEGPFGDHYGYYSLMHDYPVFKVKALAHRKDAIFTATVVGKPRQEDYFIGEYLQKLLSPLFPVVMPAVSDLWSYGETGFHSLAAAVVKQRYKREAMASAFRILGEGQLSLTKFLLVVDRPMDLTNIKSTLEYVLARFDPRTDLYVFSNLSMDTLDYAGPKVNEGSKGVLLGVGEPIRNLPREFHGTLPHGVSRASAFCAGCLVVDGPTFEQEKDLAARIAHHAEFKEWPLIVIVDDAEETVSSAMKFLWKTFTRFEPGADIHAASKSIERNHIAYQGSLVIDSRMKPWYPAELVCDPETEALVTKRWLEYFPK